MSERIFCPGAAEAAAREAQIEAQIAQGWTDSRTGAPAPEAAQAEAQTLPQAQAELPRAPLPQAEAQTLPQAQAELPRAPLPQEAQAPQMPQAQEQALPQTPPAQTPPALPLATPEEMEAARRRTARKRAKPSAPQAPQAAPVSGTPLPAPAASAAPLPRLPRDEALSAVGAFAAKEGASSAGRPKWTRQAHYNAQAGETIATDGVAAAVALSDPDGEPDADSDFADAQRGYKNIIPGYRAGELPQAPEGARIAEPSPEAARTLSARVKELREEVAGKRNRNTDVSVLLMPDLSVSTDFTEENMAAALGAFDARRLEQAAAFAERMSAKGAGLTVYKTGERSPLVIVGGRGYAALMGRRPYVEGLQAELERARAAKAEAEKAAQAKEAGAEFNVKARLGASGLPAQELRGADESLSAFAGRTAYNPAYSAPFYRRTGEFAATDGRSVAVLTAPANEAAGEGAAPSADTGLPLDRIVPGYRPGAMPEPEGGFEVDGLRAAYMARYIARNNGKASLARILPNGRAEPAQLADAGGSAQAQPAEPVFNAARLAMALEFAAKASDDGRVRIVFLNDSGNLLAMGTRGYAITMAADSPERAQSLARRYRPVDAPPNFDAPAAQAQSAPKRRRSSSSYAMLESRAEQGGARAQSAGAQAQGVYNPDADVSIVDGRGVEGWQNLKTPELRALLRDMLLGKEVEIASDGRIVEFSDDGIRSLLKKRGIHRRSLPMLQDLVENSHYFDSFPNDGAPKHARLRGQHSYYAALRLEDGVYPVEIRLDSHIDNSTDTFKGQTLKAKIADVALSAQRPLNEIVHQGSSAAGAASTTSAASVKLADLAQGSPRKSTATIAQSAPLVNGESIDAANPDIYASMEGGAGGYDDEFDGIEGDGGIEEAGIPNAPDADAMPGEADIPAPAGARPLRTPLGAEAPVDPYVPHVDLAEAGARRIAMPRIMSNTVMKGANANAASFLVRLYKGFSGGKHPFVADLNPDKEAPGRKLGDYNAATGQIRLDEALFQTVSPEDDQEIVGAANKRHPGWRGNAAQKAARDEEVRAGRAALVEANMYEAEARQTLTLAHEIGHFIDAAGGAKNLESKSLAALFLKLGRDTSKAFANAAFQARNPGVTEARVRGELENLYSQYRLNPDALKYVTRDTPRGRPEIMAEGLALYLVNPAWMEAEAPGAHLAYEAMMDDNPEIADAVAGMRAEIARGGPTFDERAAQAGETQARIQADEARKASRLWPREVRDSFVSLLFNRYAAVNGMARRLGGQVLERWDAAKRDVSTSNAQAVRIAQGEVAPLYRFMDANGISNLDLSVHMRDMRVAWEGLKGATPPPGLDGVFSAAANRAAPGGLGVAESRRKLEQMQRDEPGRYAALERARQMLVAVKRKEYTRLEPSMRRIFGDAGYEWMRDNDVFAHFQIAQVFDFDFLRNAKGRGNSPAARASGSLGELGDAFTDTLEEIAALSGWVAHQDLASLAIQILAMSPAAPDGVPWVKESKVKTLNEDGTAAEYSEPEAAGFKQVSMMNGGRIVKYDVPNHIANALLPPPAKGALSRAAAAYSSVERALLTTVSPGFQAANAVRDDLRTASLATAYMHLGLAEGFVQFHGAKRRAYADAWNSVARKEHSPEVLNAMARGMLSPNMESVSDMLLGTLSRAGFKNADMRPKMHGTVQRAWKEAARLGAIAAETDETANKLAVLNMFDDYNARVRAGVIKGKVISESRIRAVVNDVGRPSMHDRSILGRNAFLRLCVPFYDVLVKAPGKFIEHAIDTRGRFLLAAAVQNPLLIATPALAAGIVSKALESLFGLSGDDEEDARNINGNAQALLASRFMGWLKDLEAQARALESRRLFGYASLPLGWDGEDGKAKNAVRYLSLPIDPSLAAVHSAWGAVVNKIALDRSPADALDVAGGMVLPGLSPAANTVVFALTGTDINYGWRKFEARPGQSFWDANKRRLYNALSLNTLGLWRMEEPRNADDRSGWEKMRRVPLLARFMGATRGGDREETFQAAQEYAGARAGVRRMYEDAQSARAHSRAAYAAGNENWRADWERAAQDERSAAAAAREWNQSEARRRYERRNPGKSGSIKASEVRDGVRSAFKREAQDAALPRAPLGDGALPRATPEEMRNAKLKRQAK